MPNIGDVNPSNANYVWGSNNKWVLKSTLGEGGLNAGVTTTPTTTTAPPTGATRVGPTEFNQLRAGLGVDETNFDQFFWRDPSGNDIYKLQGVKVPDNISSDSLTGNTDVNLVNQSETDNSSINNIEAGANQSLLDFNQIMERFNQQSDLQQTVNEQQKSFLDRVSSTLAGERERREELFEQFDVSGQQKQLGELMTQLASRKAAFDKAISDVSLRPQDKVFGVGLQSKLARQSAVELGGMAAMAQAVQGNITMATDLIDQTVQTEFQPLKDEIEILKQQLDINYDNLSLEQQKRATQLTMVLDERARILGQQETMKLNIANLAIQAAQGGAPNDVLQRMVNSTSYASAIALGGQYLQKQPSISEQLAAADAGYDVIGGQIIPQGANQISSFSGHSYDLSTYATDPAHAEAVQGYINRMGQFNSIADIDSYIYSVNPESPITGQMIANAATQQGIGWEELTALMQHETAGFQSNVMQKNNNPGGITWSSSYQKSHANVSKGTARPSAEGGNYVRFNTMQDGVNAVAEQLSFRQIQGGAQQTDSEIENLVKLVQQGKLTSNQALDEIPEKQTERRQQLRDALANSFTNVEQARDESLVTKANKVELLKNHPGLGSLVGPIPGSRFNPIASLTGTKDDFRAIMDSLLSEFSLEALIASKERGATYGQLSDNELRIIGAAASKLNAAAVRNDEGKIKYFDISEKDFKDELQNISNTLRNQIKNQDLVQNNPLTYDPLGLFSTGSNSSNTNSTNPLGL